MSTCCGFVFLPVKAASLGDRMSRHQRLLLAIGSKRRDPNPKDNSLIRKETSTHKGTPFYVFAAVCSY